MGTEFPVYLQWVGQILAIGYQENDRLYRVPRASVSGSGTMSTLEVFPPWIAVKPRRRLMGLLAILGPL